MKNILFLVTGMTPQIITETVWALACDTNNPAPWIPDEIHVMSTDHGLTQIRSRLFSDDKEGQHFARFKADYPQLQQIRFTADAEFLHTITDQNGHILKDLKTPQDNECAADMICAKIREFTQDPDTCLHVSIAGGRKTMGFYAGYALSLYGRAQDSMSHVLVDERYESLHDFFYPSPDDSVFVTNRDGIKFKAKEATIWLADIPFVRMKEAIKQNHQLSSGAGFSETVQKINESFKPVTLVLDIGRQTMTVNDEITSKRISARTFAMLYWFADNRKNGEATNGIRIPKLNLSDASYPYKSSEGEREYIQNITKTYTRYYNILKIQDVFDREKTEQEEDNYVLDKSNFDINKTNLKTALTKFLGLELANRIIFKKNAEGAFYLDLPPENISIINVPKRALGD